MENDMKQNCDPLEKTLEMPAEVIQAEIEVARRRALVAAGLVKPINEFQEGGMLRRQAD